MDELRLFSGTGNPELASKIADKLGVSLGEMKVTRFLDGEIYTQVEQSVRGDDVFVVQSAAEPVNEHLMELLIMIDTFVRASVRRLTVVTPYYFYGRQDRKVKPREPVTAKLVANLLTTAGAGRLLTVDLHSGQIMGFFDIPVDHLYAGPIIAEYLKKNVPMGEGTVVVSPDVGGVTRARALAEFLNEPLAIITKRRPEPNRSEVTELIGDVSGKTAIMIDDLIDTGGSVISGARWLLERGAREVYVACTHAVFSGDAVRRLEESPIKKVIVTDTIPLHPHSGGTGDSAALGDSKIEVVTVSGILADAIKRIHLESSVSELFSKHWKGQS